LKQGWKRIFPGSLFFYLMPTLITTQMILSLIGMEISSQQA
jgi:hypothetical protein